LSEAAFEIRPARAEDADALAPVWLSMAGQHEAYSPQEWVLIDDRGEAAERWKTFFRESVGKEETIALVAAGAAGRPVGYLLGGMTGAPPVLAVQRRGQVRGMCVAESWRGRGVGRALLGRAIEEMRARGAANVSLSVASANEAGVRFYRSMGLEVVAHKMTMPIAKEGEDRP
jgi:ribosomal protein S18 acetylase RimI-like enzyme